MELLSFLILLGASFLNGIFSEGITWILIYREEGYQNLKARIDKLTKQVDRDKAVAIPSKQVSKKLQRNETNLKELNAELQKSKIKSSFAIMFCLVALYNLLSSWFDGIVIAKLPFVPFGLLQGWTHRNITGNDFTDCSFLFIYIVSSIFMKQNIQKYYGNVPRTPSMFDQPSQS